MFFYTLNCALLCCTLRYSTRLLRKQGPTLCETELAETTHVKHWDEKNPASADLIKAWDNHQVNEELSLIPPFLELQGKANLIPASQPAFSVTSSLSSSCPVMRNRIAAQGFGMTVTKHWSPCISLWRHETPRQGVILQTAFNRWWCIFFGELREKQRQCYVIFFAFCCCISFRKTPHIQITDYRGNICILPRTTCGWLTLPEELTDSDNFINGCKDAVTPFHLTAHPSCRTPAVWDTLRSLEHTLGQVLNSQWICPALPSYRLKLVHPV